MSLASRVTLAGTSALAIGIIIFVHYAQEAEKAAMHKGVIRDLELQRLKKERQQDFEIQSALEAEYRKMQHVNDENHGNDKDTTKTISTSSRT